MKLSKFAAIVKRTKVCTLLHVDGSGIWLATRGAVYKATELPEIHGGEQLCTVLDIDPTAARSIHTDETHFTGADNIFGMDLTDTADELEAAAYTNMQLIYKGRAFSALLCSSGELVFYDADLLAPLSNTTKHSDYVRFTVRSAKSGERIITVKDGFEVLAGITQIRLLDEEFMKELAEFESMCAAQYMLERQRE